MFILSQEVTAMNRKEQLKQQEQADQNKFNSITQKNEAVNQNQNHNVRKEGIQPINRKR